MLATANLAAFLPVYFLLPFTEVSIVQSQPTSRQILSSIHESIGILTSSMLTELMGVRKGNYWVIPINMFGDFPVRHRSIIWTVGFTSLEYKEYKKGIYLCVFVNTFSGTVKMFSLNLTQKNRFSFSCNCEYKCVFYLEIGQGSEQSRLHVILIPIKFWIP